MLTGVFKIFEYCLEGEIFPLKAKFSIRTVTLAIALMATVAFASGYERGLNNLPGEPLSKGQLKAPIIDKPGSGASRAALYFAALYSPALPPPSPSVPSVIVESALPPVDIAAEFRRDVTAILTGGPPHVVLAEGRKLAEGQIYRDGWEVRDLTAQTAVLSKGRDILRINLFSAPVRESSPDLSASEGKASEVADTQFGGSSGGALAPAMRKDYAGLTLGMTSEERALGIRP